MFLTERNKIFKAFLSLVLFPFRLGASSKEQLRLTEVRKEIITALLTLMQGHEDLC